ncbi:MAG: Hsp20/alpha crystallin family protein [Gemmataceae bacterium]
MFSLIPGFVRNKNGLVNQVASPLSTLERDFQNMFGSLLAEFPMADSLNNPQWGLDVEETETETLVRAELPGFEVGDLDVQVHDDVLTIEAKHAEENKEESEGEKGSFFRRVQHVRRSIRLPKGHDSEKVEANYRNGVLELRIPRLPEAVARKVEIKG